MKRHRVGSLDIPFKDSQKNSSSHSEDSLSEIICVFTYNEIVFQDWLNVSYQVPRLIKAFRCHSAARTALRCSCAHLQTFVEFDCFRRLYCPDVLPPHSLFRSQQPRGLHGTIVCFKRRIWFAKLLFFSTDSKNSGFTVLDSAHLMQENLTCVRVITSVTHRARGNPVLVQSSPPAVGSVPF